MLTHNNAVVVFFHKSGDKQECLMLAGGKVLLYIWIESCGMPSSVI